MTHAFLGLELAYWQQTVIRLLAGLVAVLLLTGGVVYLYLFKFVSFMQSRLGPMEAGPYGSMQLLAEVGKWLQKEDIHTENSDRLIFGLAPAIVLASTFLMFVVIPAGPNAVIADLGTGVYYVLAMSSLSVIGHPDGRLGLGQQVRPHGCAACRRPAHRLRAAAGAGRHRRGHPGRQPQPAGHRGGPGRRRDLRLAAIGNPYIITQIVGFLIFAIAMQAELTQTPFDMPVAESELVAGYMVEYTGIRFLVYFIAEFATAVGVRRRGLDAVPRRLGRCRTAGASRTGPMHVIGPIMISIKAVLLVGVVFWVRFSLPRFREDQLQRLAWKFLIPIALANIAITAVLKVVF